MKLKKFMALGLATVLTSSMLVGCSSGGSESSTEDASQKTDDGVIKIGMITDTGGVNDESFNQSAWKGLQDAQKELGEDKLEVKYLESNQDSDYTPNIETFVDEDMDLIIGVGFKLKPAIEEASGNYPEQKFAIIDEVVSKDNVVSLLYEDHVSSYLAGLVAGKMTETNKVGFIGGIKGEVLERFRWGFRAGVEAANPEAEYIDQYVDSFTDVAKGKSTANQMHSQGVDVILTAAGAVGTGAIEAAKENNKKAVGVDQDQNYLAPDNVITSAMKNIDVSVANLCKELVNGNFKGGETIVNTLAMGGVGISPTTNKNVQPDVLEFVNEQAEKIKSGEIKVPQNEEEYNELNKGASTEEATEETSEVEGE